MVSSYRLDEDGKIHPASIPEHKTIFKDEIDDIIVSTVFLGIDHSFGVSGPPVLFETMVFGIEDVEYEPQWRATSLEDATANHMRGLLMAKEHHKEKTRLQRIVKNINRAYVYARDTDVVNYNSPWSLIGFLSAALLITGLVIMIAVAAADDHIPTLYEVRANLVADDFKHHKECVKYTGDNKACYQRWLREYPTRVVNGK